jgi:hypothetical protein
MFVFDEAEFDEAGGDAAGCAAVVYRDILEPIPGT